jgi:hypothetical protein
MFDHKISKPTAQNHAYKKSNDIPYRYPQQPCRLTEPAIFSDLQRIARSPQPKKVYRLSLRGNSTEIIQCALNFIFLVWQ